MLVLFNFTKGLIISHLKSFSCQAAYQALAQKKWGQGGGANPYSLPRYTYERYGSVSRSKKLRLASHGICAVFS